MPGWSSDKYAPAAMLPYALLLDGQCHAMKPSMPDTFMEG